VLDQQPAGALRKSPNANNQDQPILIG